MKLPPVRKNEKGRPHPNRQGGGQGRNSQAYATPHDARRRISGFFIYNAALKGHFWYFGKRTESMNDRSKKSNAYRELKAALLRSLKARGLDDKAYTDKVNEYMDFWERRRELRDDVAKRGLTVVDERGRVMENRSVSLEVQVSRQMLAIFAALGFRPEDLRQAPESEDEL